MEVLDRELRNVSLSILNLFKNPPWFTMPLEDMLMTMIHAAITKIS